MNRRQVLFACAGLTGIATAALAQERGRVYRLGVLVPGLVAREAVTELALPALARFGFEEGRNLELIIRVGEPSALPALAHELAKQSPHAILAVSTPAVSAVHAASNQIPIISYGPDLISAGMAHSLARPGGNVTGVTVLATQIEPKRLEVISQAVPNARKVGVLLYVNAAKKAEIAQQLGDAAKTLGLIVLFAEMDDPARLGPAIEKLSQDGAEALLITAHSVLYNNIDEILRHARAARMPTICEWMDGAGKGCTIGYGPNRRLLYERAADMIAQVLRGASPAIIPAESPSQIGLSINLAAARSLNLTIPALLFARADEVIE